MYNFVLTLHNLFRWLVLITAVIALVRAYGGISGRKVWAAADDRAGMLFTMMLDIQILIGIILYFFLSPTTQAFLSGQTGMGSALARYFAVEHVFIMIIAAVVAHIGRSLSKKAATDQGKFRRAAVYFTIAVLLLLFAIPWPFLPTGRPWLRLFGVIF